MASRLTAQEWEHEIGARVRATMASAELAHYFAVKMTPRRAQAALLQLSLFVSCRRDGWANLIANCDAPPIRRRLMAHEYDELVEDESSSKGHYDLLIRQGVLVGLTPMNSPKSSRCARAWRRSTAGSGSPARRPGRMALSL